MVCLLWGDCMTTGQRIKEARKKAGLTQAELAKMLGVSNSFIAQYENDLRKPKIETLQRIAVELEISPTALLPDSTIESWKSGKQYGSDESIQKLFEYGYHFSDDEIELVNIYWDLNKSGREKAIERVRELGEIPRYLKPSRALGEIPRYQRPAPPESTPPAREGEATPPPDAPETPSESKQKQ